jgi:hypothetical protein
VLKTMPTGTQEPDAPLLAQMEAEQQSKDAEQRSKQAAPAAVSVH